MDSGEMEDTGDTLLVSLSVLGLVLLLCELLRRVTDRFAPLDSRMCLLELTCTLQLCWCSQEQKLLAESSVPISVRLTLLYVVTLVHLGTFRGASCSPIGPLERVWRGRLSFKKAVGIVSLQMVAALIAQGLAILVWAQGWSWLHQRHRRFGYTCSDPLGGTLLEAAVVELILTFFIQTVVLHLHHLEEPLRPYMLSAAITAAVFAGGAISGAVLNPVLAVSLVFPCSGHLYLEYMFVYWLGPALGVLCCNLLFEIIVPFLCGRSFSGQSLHKQKTH